MLTTYQKTTIKIMAKISRAITMNPVITQKTRMASSIVLLDGFISIVFGFIVCIPGEKKSMVIIMFKFSNASGI